MNERATENKDDRVKVKKYSKSPEHVNIYKEENF